MTRSGDKAYLCVRILSGRSCCCPSVRALLARNNPRPPLCLSRVPSPEPVGPTREESSTQPYPSPSDLSGLSTLRPPNSLLSSSLVTRTLPNTSLALNFHRRSFQNPLDSLP